MSTPHNEAKPGEICETILLPGDPLRAKYIADNFLTDVVKFNDVRNMLGFSGKYEGRPVSVMGAGMGAASTGIYAYELIHHFGVKQLIRVGSAGSMQAEVKVKDVVIAMGASTDTNFAAQYNLPGQISAVASFDLLKRAEENAQNMGIRHHVGNVVSSDFFYNDAPDNWKIWAKMGVLAMEMEAHALYLTAARAGVKALALLTVSDSFLTGEIMSADERESGFANMVKIALQLA
ncbi:MAG: purine-nucleoside phosphorylase [Saprospiraceae bacterium]|nr:purine-nucleoside phosphorylase [Saprospiraceae bacterium]